jgi:hypothetical protein
MLEVARALGELKAQGCVEYSVLSLGLEADVANAL